ncbi:KdsC family phosphatase [Halorhodospira halophila]|uniref:3-deoxy-D-manno-octulosonate 8-phosphate phosphatase KdsC n=1 Tax=Halorhodospira halophila (strain DSM 244 / SL1) TaxID=349124 RepID=A1WYX4_HALHL|nr:HAD hydrolase family protein [Halorhodospira halophila]ABM62886.1 3-deoxy-D-manno-octulosonate 8-phosphate phosphatase, YrbI family [Halorhodospira halophila SL1]MBK1727991.1 phenylphosphate carboxylase subunit delta [Halorhodospira halophila]
MSTTVPRPYCEPPAPEVLRRAESVRLALFDVDGVLTDGTVFVGGSGDPLQAFHIHDGKGLRMLQDADIEVGWITARGGHAVMRRAEELGVRHVLRGRSDKGQALVEVAERLGLALEACAYTGDDLIDLPAVRHAGFGVAVADGHPHLHAHADWVTVRPGGRGAVREVAELILHAQGQLEPMLRRAEG